ncbi:endolytic transglycosylase MltG [Lachnoanaerobaculum saburreum]|jgi:aminodeoxychorismate lyase|uniref:Aminodeoxychorismate lyase n=1 Tax=Lachnoanaerobaculum saburreum DSM 3986 TaxID=887325 RepID=E6LRA0_9FIRM|nr:endolytic transglycosylase MltG [Lachnoanaerobaculum saburreum]EFU75621.1 hypothetical protein HMPREF0381_2485 [Lachnoanaerobaculum saburreum DSM 3986]
MSKETTSDISNNISKKKTKKRVTSFLGRIVTYIMLLIMLVGIPFSFQFGHSIFYASSVDSPPGRNVEMTIEDGMSFGKLADKLYENGVIGNKLSFEIQAKFFDIRMHSGEYTFNTSQTSRQILEMIDDGKSGNKNNDNKS